LILVPSPIFHLALKILATRVSGFFMSFQHCLATIAILNKCKSRKPSPPSSFEYVIQSQANQRIPLSFDHPPHQNAFIIRSISLILYAILKCFTCVVTCCYI
jgi:hypothetical protein